MKRFNSPKKGLVLTGLVIAVILLGGRRAKADFVFGEPVNLGPPINTSSNEATFCLSADDLEMYISSNRSGTYGIGDIWVSTRPTINDNWTEPVNLGPVVNSPFPDTVEYISPDGLALLFHSMRPGGSGGHDMWMTRRRTTDDDWNIPVNLGPMLNSASDDIMPNISADGSILYFCSPRPGGLGAWDIYQAPIIPIVDFNDDGIVESADMCIMIDHWGENYSLCDIGPTPFGDGIVDVQDLIILAEHLFEEILPIGCVAYWRLDQKEGNIAHNSAGYNDGICHGEPLWQPAGGQVAGALQFDGIDDYIETDFVISLMGGAFSVFTWILDGAPGQAIISQADGDGTGYVWLGMDVSDGKLMSGLGLVSAGSPIPPLPTLLSESVITDGEWHHIGVVITAYQSMRFRTLYLGGVRVAMDTQSVELPSSNGGLYIGAGKNLEAGTFFSGLIDDVCIYDVALGAEQIEGLYR